MFSQILAFFARLLKLAANVTTERLDTMNAQIQDLQNSLASLTAAFNTEQQKSGELRNAVINFVKKSQDSFQAITAKVEQLNAQISQLTANSLTAEDIDALKSVSVNLQSLAAQAKADSDADAQTILEQVPPDTTTTTATPPADPGTPTTPPAA